MLELWHEWNSVHSFKVRVALAEKRLEWVDRRIELLAFEHLTPEYLRLNPNGVVPTLVHDGAAIFESSVICQYLDEAFPEPPLLPPSPRLRAGCRTWLKYFDDAVHAPVRRASFELLYRPRLAAMAPTDLSQRLRAHPDARRAQAFLEAAAERRPDARAIAEAREAFERIVLRVEEGLRGGDWLSGSAFGMADVSMAAFVERLDVLGMNDVWTRPLGRDWARRMMERPSVKHSRAPAPYRLLPNPPSL